MTEVEIKCKLFDSQSIGMKAQTHTHLHTRTDTHTPLCTQNQKALLDSTNVN